MESLESGLQRIAQKLSGTEEVPKMLEDIISHIADHITASSVESLGAVSNSGLTLFKDADGAITGGILKDSLGNKHEVLIKESEEDN